MVSWQKMRGLMLIVGSQGLEIDIREKCIMGSGFGGGDRSSRVRDNLFSKRCRVIV